MPDDSTLRSTRAKGISKKSHQRMSNLQSQRFMKLLGRRREISETPQPPFIRKNKSSLVSTAALASRSYRGQEAIRDEPELGQEWIKRSARRARFRPNRFRALDEGQPVSTTSKKLATANRIVARPSRSSSSRLTAHSAKSVRLPTILESDDRPQTQDPGPKNSNGSDKTQTAVEKIFATFPHNTPEFETLYQSLSTRKWYEIDNVPSEISDLGLRVPFLIPADKCWESGKLCSLYDEILPALTKNDFWTEQEAMEIEIPHSSSNKQKKRPPNHYLLSQLIYKQLIFSPPQGSPMIAHNVPLKTASTISTKELPVSTIQDTINYAVNITPKSSIVDIHIDQGTSGIAVPIGDLSRGDPEAICVEKIWFLWPPTPKNLQIYSDLWQSFLEAEKIKPSVDTTSHRLLRSASLEHGVIAQFGVESGIFLPSGWMHATVTLRGGFLGGITFHSFETIASVNQIMAMDIGIYYDRFCNDVDLYVTGLVHWLESEDDKHVLQAAQGWVAVAGALKKAGWRPNFRVNKTAAKKLLDIWLDDKVKARLDALGKVRCSCRMKHDAFGKHFLAEHLKILRYAGYKHRPLGRS